MHLDLDDPVTLACLASPSAHVEAESARLVTAHLRLGKAREQVAHIREHSCVRGRVRSRRATDWRLVDVDRLVQVLEALDGPMRSWPVLRLVEVLSHLAAQDVCDQRRFPGTADTRHRNETSQRNRDVNVL